jgi:hypothetical protein
MMSAHSHRTRPIASERYVLLCGAWIFCRNAIAAANRTALHAAVIVTSSDRVALLSVLSAKKITELPTAMQTANPSSNTRELKLSITTTQPSFHQSIIYVVFFRVYIA